MLISKTANAQVNPPELKLDSSKTANSDSSLDAVQSPKDTVTAVAEPESLEWEESELTPRRSLADKTSNSQSSTLGKAALTQNTSNSPSCIPTSIGEPEFTNRTELEKNQHNSDASISGKANFTQETKTKNTGDYQPCIPINIGQPEFTRIADLKNNQNQSQYLISEEKASTQNSDSTQKNLQFDANYIIKPRIIPKNQVNTFTTTIPLNGRTINHLSESEVIGSFSFGDAQNNTFNINSFFPINSQVTESLTRDNIFTVEQTGDYFQLQTVRKANEITVNRIEPITILASEIQLSLLVAVFYLVLTLKANVRILPVLSLIRIL
ncbi:MAG: hypothetical protein HC908_06030 [Calothrix sp. SM1_7_51]|nr:hypothetical protein [Calothrix sp. SM1_7_51]